MRHYLLPLTAALSLSACAPRALYFHESTKVAFAADYNTSDTQPIATSFGFKRRIVAVVPSQEREIPEGGSERTGTNTGEALSIVSKFSVRVGAREGVAITNNFASGMAARLMTRSGLSPEALSVLMHSVPIPVSAETGKTIDGNKPAAEAVNERLARIKLKEVHGSDVPRSSGALVMPPRKPAGVPGNSGALAMPPKKPAGAPGSSGALVMPPKKPAGAPESSGPLPMPPAR